MKNIKIRRMTDGNNIDNGEQGMSEGISAKAYRERISTSLFLAGKKLSIPGVQVSFWDPVKKEVQPEVLSMADCIVHLAGANIGEKRWTKSKNRSS